MGLYVELQGQRQVTSSQNQMEIPGENAVQADSTSLASGARLPCLTYTSENCPHFLYWTVDGLEP